MLGNLMKYEFKAIGRIMLPIYAAWIVISLLFGITIRTSANPDNPGTFMIIAILLFTAIITIAGVMTLVLIVQRFSKGLLGNEGYLMMSVPATAAQHIWNKGLSSGIWCLFSAIIGVLSMLAVGLPLIVGQTGALEGLVEAFRNLVDFGFGKGILVLVEIAAVIVLCAVAFAFQIYAAISIGHQANKHQGALSVAAYVAILIVEGIVGNTIARLTGIGHFFNVEFTSSFAAMQYGLLIIAIIYIIKGAVYYCITWYLTKNRLNLQ